MPAQPPSGVLPAVATKCPLRSKTRDIHAQTCIQCLADRLTPVQAVEVGKAPVPKAVWGAHSATKWRTSRKGHPNAPALQDRSTNISWSKASQTLAPSARHHAFACPCSIIANVHVLLRLQTHHHPPSGVQPRLRRAQSVTQWSASRTWHPNALAKLTKSYKHTA